MAILIEIIILGESSGGDGSDPYVKNTHSQEKNWGLHHYFLYFLFPIGNILLILLMAILPYENHLITKIQIYFWSVPQSLSLCPRATGRYRQSFFLTPTNVQLLFQTEAAVLFPFLRLWPKQHVIPLKVLYCRVPSMAHKVVVSSDWFRYIRVFS